MDEEPVRRWRCFGIRYYRDRPLILTGSTGTQWLTREIHAECHSDGTPHGTVQLSFLYQLKSKFNRAFREEGQARCAQHLREGTCWCGIHFMGEPPHSLLAVNHWSNLLGACTLWGPNAECEHSTHRRYQFARLDKLWIRPPMCTLHQYVALREHQPREECEVLGYVRTREIYPHIWSVCDRAREAMEGQDPQLERISLEEVAERLSKHLDVPVSTELWPNTPWPPQ